jgi:hypothetical protein
MPIFPRLERLDETEIGPLALGLEPNHENRTMDPKLLKEDSFRFTFNS